MPFPVDIRFIEQTEQKLGARFPLSFRYKMLQDNGGEIEALEDDWQLHPFLDSSDKRRLRRTCNDIVRETQVMKSWSGWPPSAINIASNGCGDHLVFLRTDEGFGPEVYHWFHETGELTKVADDFSKLI